MASLVLSGDTSGSITVAAPAVSGSNTQTLAAVTGTLAPIVSGTAVTASGTSVDFTGIPSWVKRVTVMFNGLSSNGTSAFLLQLGDSGGIETTGYTGVAARGGSASNAYETSTAGFPLSEASVAASNFQSLATLALLDATTNTWVISGTTSYVSANSLSSISGGKSLSDTLTQVRITTVNGTDTFDAGTINILYE